MVSTLSPEVENNESTALFHLDRGRNPQPFGIRSARANVHIVCVCWCRSSMLLGRHWYHWEHRLRSQLYGGCDYYGGPCSNGQYGPPTPGAYCFFYPNDSACQSQVFYKDYTMQACMPSLKNELLSFTPLPGQSIRLIRTKDGQLVRFEHSL